MTTVSRLAVYVGVLGVVAAAAAGLGYAVGPLGGTAVTGEETGGSIGHSEGAEAATGRDRDTAGSPDASGLAVSRDDYTLAVAQTTLPVGRKAPLSFQVLADDGRPVRAFDLEGGVRMHLIVVRRDLTGYQHLHPTLSSDGTFTTELALPAAGVWRAFADFERDGRKTVLGADLHVAGAFTPERLPLPTRSVSTGGYEVELAATPRAGHADELVFHVRRGGQAVALEPYLGARGHLVALREGDLAYLHVHPLPDAPAGEVSFAATFPSAGRYRLFLQFQSAGNVETAAFTIEVRR